MRIVNGQEIVISPQASARAAPVPPRRPGAIVVSRALRTSPREASSDPKDPRGQIVDILV